MESPRNQGTIPSFYPPQYLVVVGWVEMQVPGPYPRFTESKSLGPGWRWGRATFFTNVSRKF